ncbi:MAG: hypothetical protein DHS20C21_01600 [Gemmatimonadota bacterium]|nr:MAG: hypothetical protein DHS20C21_01600 [Gemmatimonadota bacterium]
MTSLVRRILAGISAALSTITSAIADPTSAAGQVVTRHFDEVLNARPVRIYVPPGYDESSDRYPVLYMLDGQNLFDEATSFAGEWGVDETCDREIAAGRLRPIIVVGIDNGGFDRMTEYTPWPDADRGVGGGAREHLQAIVRALKPRIDAEYRTLPDAAHTGIAGSSLGGLMTLFAALEAPRTFSRFAALSPSLGWANERVTREFESGRPRDARVYVDMGTLEMRRVRDRNHNGVDDSIDLLRAFEDVARRRLHRPDDDLLVVEDEGGVHHESAWARRIGDALVFLFPNSV